jgi:hypothetical protein
MGVSRAANEFVQVAALANRVSALNKPSHIQLQNLV